MAKSKMKKIVAPEQLTQSIVALYIRVSTDKQREEGFSIDIQKERLRAYATSMFPGAVVKEYVDDGFSGGSLDRPQMKMLIEDVKEKRVTHVVVLKLDRLSRSQKDTLYLIEDVFLPHNVAFISMGESFNTATPFGRAVVGILSVFAQLERENIFERTRSGMQKRVELGYWPGGGRTPFGYDYDETQGILVPNKDADTVRKIYDLYLGGMSLQNIADLCGLSYERLASQIIKRKSNTGVIVYNGEEYKGRHQPLVSEETYNKAMLMMQERSSARCTVFPDHLLSGLVYCGVCGAKMRYQKWGKAGTKLVCYSQQKSKRYLIRDENCDNIKPWADDVEAAVLDAVFARVSDPAPVDEGTTDRTMSDILKEQKSQAERKLRRLYDLYSDNPNDILLASITDLTDQIKDIEHKLDIEQKRSAVTERAHNVQIKLEEIESCWPYMTPTEKQSVLRELINKISVEKGHVHVDFRY